MHGDDQSEPGIRRRTAVRLRGKHTHGNAARNPCVPRKGGVAGRGAVVTHRRRPKATQVGPGRPEVSRAGSAPAGPAPQPLPQPPLPATSWNSGRSAG
jgi:hypothetical protein